MCCATVRDVTERSVTPCAQFACPLVKWCTEVDAIVHVGPSYPPASNGCCIYGGQQCIKKEVDICHLRMEVEIEQAWKEPAEIMHIDHNSESPKFSRWSGLVVGRGGCQLRCRPRHLTVAQYYEVRR
ncbi:hypothetical protein TNCV_2846831 [Trichonephila clavipes]|nr:hypothetical protein TNCV_2846831 [Trichonephila clavipes]